MNVNRLKMIGLILLLTTGLLGNGSPVQCAAQQSSAESTDEAPLEGLPNDQVHQRANQLIEGIKASHGSFQRYEQAMTNASHEDKQVLALQVFSIQKRIVNDVYQLADMLLYMEKKLAQPQLRNQIEQIFLRALPGFQSEIERLRSDIDRLRASRSEAAVDQRFSLEASIAQLTMRLDTIFEMYLRHVQKMKEVNMDIKKARHDLALLLSDRADELSGRIELALSRINALEERQKAIPDDTDAAKLLGAMAKSMGTNSGSLEVTLALMDEWGLDTEALRSQLATVTSDYSSILKHTGVAVDLAARILNNIIGWLVDNGPSFLLKVLLVVGIIFIFRFVTRFVRKGLDQAIESSNLNLSQLARRMIVNTSANLVMLFGLMLALSQLGISLGPLLAGFGVAGFIVGFALQDTLGNFASGMMILLYRPYDVGDLVEVGGMSGRVDKMSLVSTTLLTLDNQEIVIPNNKIWGDVIKNVTAQTIRRVDMVFGIAYSDDIPKAEQILEDILRAHDRILDDPEPVVRLHTLGASSVDFVVRPWVKVDDYWDVYWDVTRTVKLRFDEEGISIPFPQRDVHVYYENLPNLEIESPNPGTASV